MRRAAMLPELRAAIAYAERVADGRIKAGRWARMAAERFIADLKRTRDPKCPFRFDHGQAVFAIRFAELLVNTKGVGAGEHIKLLPFQRFMLAAMFGFLDRKTGRRRFRQAAIFLPKGNGKSTLAAILGLMVAFTEGEGGAEAYSAAVSRDQASIAFNMGKAIAEQTPDFRREFGIEVLAHAVTQPRTGSSFKALSGHSRALDGLNVSFAVCDEIASHKTSGVYDSLVTATSKREQPLLVSISTATDQLAGIGRSLWNYCEQILNGTVRDDRFFAVIYAADEDDDPWIETTWRKANPAWGTLVMPEGIRAIAKQARHSPLLSAAFITRHLNRWVSAEQALFNLAIWTACADPGLQLDRFRGARAFAALDMATRVDLAAAALVFPWRHDDGERMQYAIFSRAWLPRSSIERVPAYAAFAAAGQLTIVDGETNDYALIEDWCREVCAAYDVQAIGYDPWNMEQASQRLRNEGLPLIAYRPTVMNMSAPTKEFDALMRERRIAHDGDPVLGWCVGNVVGHIDTRENVLPKRESPDKKIDCAIAAISALGVAMAAEVDKAMIYTDRGLMVF